MDINIIVRCLFVLFIFIINSSAFAGEVNLIKLTEPLANPAVIKHNNMIYVMGGNDEKGARASVIVVSLKTGEWKKLPEMLHARFTHSAVYYNGRIYVFGGIQSDKLLNSVESMDIKTGIWREEKNMPVAKARFGLARFADKVYIFGGIDGNSSASSSVQVFDFTSETWSEKEKMPLGVNRLSAVNVGETVYLIGGEDKAGNTISSVYAYDIKNNVFKQVSSLNHPRKNFAALSDGNRLVVAGGWEEKDNKKTFLNSTEIYNPSSGKWEDGPPMKEGRDGTRGILAGKILYLFGGYNLSLLSSVEEINLEKMPFDWKIDENLKFHLAYIPDGTEKISGKSLETPLPLGFMPDFLPDIANINLADIKGLGFELPSREKPELYNLYLKLFKFPGSFQVKDSTLPVEKDYLLDKIRKSDLIEKFILNPYNVAVKMGTIAKSDEKFSAENPCPSLKIGKNKEFQKYFNSRTFFTSLYVNPLIDKDQFVSDDERAEWSAGGVLAFHRDLLEVYNDNLIPMSGQENDKYYYFTDKKVSKNDIPCSVTVFKIPREPMVFKNWKNLVMPNDPKHIFLSGLLLVYRTDYTIYPIGGLVIGPETLETKEFLKVYQKLNGTVLEIGSVVRIPEK